jgi:hypothetical protein
LLPAKRRQCRAGAVQAALHGSDRQVEPGSDVRHLAFLPQNLHITRGKLGQQGLILFRQREETLPPLPILGQGSVRLWGVGQVRISHASLNHRNSMKFRFGGFPMPKKCIGVPMGNPAVPLQTLSSRCIIGALSAIVAPVLSILGVEISGTSHGVRQLLLGARAIFIISRAEAARRETIQRSSFISFFSGHLLLQRKAQSASDRSFGVLPLVTITPSWRAGFEWTTREA